MIKKFLLVLASSLSLMSFSQVQVGDLKFDQELIDFGTIRTNGGVVMATYNFVNNSPYTFIINDIDVACGCTKPQSYKKVIAPGDSGTIAAEFNPKGMIGEVTKWIHVKGNFTDTHWKELKFKATITDKQLYKDETTNRYYPGQFGYLLIKDPFLRLGTQLEDYQGVDSVEVMNDGDATFTVQEVKDLPPYLKITNLPLSVASKSSAFMQIEVDMREMDTVGWIGGTLKFSTDDRFFKQKELKYSIEIQQDFSKLSRRARKKAPFIEVDRLTVDMGEMRSGQLRNSTVTISNTGKSPLRIRRVDVDCSCAVLNGLPSSIEAGESYTAEVKFDALYKQGLQRKGITLYTNDPQNPVVIITVKAVVN